MIHNICPNCKETDIDGFFGIKNAPIFSIVTVKSEEDALTVPRKDIELGFCRSCGFIFNRLFDPTVDYFDLGYEDQQGFSKTFMDYLTRISKGLINKYDLKGKTLLEIGCGKGDFINLLNELAGGEGIGIDPAYVEGRQKNKNLTFYKEYYALKHGELEPDFICCRHTLEHIHQTYDFLKLIRDSIKEGSSPIIFFEIPQITRILDICAFWDIYYEHCSYYSAGSLARVFRLAGFEILDIRLDYDDQYLLIEAKPALQASEICFNIEESVEDQQLRIDRFKKMINEQLGEWRKRLEDMRNTGKKVVVWGGGSKSVGFLTNFSDLNVIEYVVDINPHMEGNYIPGIGKKYISPSYLKDYVPDVVIVMNSVYQNEISKMVADMGIYPEFFAL